MMNSSPVLVLCFTFVSVGLDVLGRHAKRWQETEIGIILINLSMLEKNKGFLNVFICRHELE